MATATELSGVLTTKRQEHTAWLATFKKDGGYDMPTDQVGEFQKRNEELDKLQGEYETALVVEKSAAQNEAKLAPQGRIISGGSEEPYEGKIKSPEGLEAAFKGAFKQHGPALKALADGGTGTVRFELPVESKTLVTLADHYPPAERLRTTGMAAFYGDVEDLFAPGSTDSSNIEYFIQTTNTTNAAAVAEGSAVTDSAYVWTKTTDEVETIQAWIPVTREFLNNNAGMQSMVTGRLGYELQAKVNQQLLSGTGTTPQLWGAFIRVGFQTQAKGADPVFDAIGKAIKLVTITGDAPADAIVMHPTDWWNMRLTRTTQGIYILGNPGDAGATFSLWGLPVRVSTGIGAAGTAGVGAFKQYAQVFNNGGVVVEASTEHSTYFTERKVALAVSRRLSVASFRPSAFATVTGL
jgi:hypothetical protein